MFKSIVNYISPFSLPLWHKISNFADKKNTVCRKRSHCYFTGVFVEISTATARDIHTCNHPSSMFIDDGKKTSKTQKKYLLTVATNTTHPNAVYRYVEFF